MLYEYPVLISSDEEGGYFAEVPDVPGVFTHGETSSVLGYLETPPPEELL